MPPPDKRLDPAVLALLALTGVLIGVRLYAARVIGFGDSEALYACYALHPRPAYLDHPGLVGVFASALGGGLIPSPQAAHVATAALASAFPWLVVIVARGMGAEVRPAAIAGLVTAAAPEIAVALGQSGDPPRPSRLEPKRCGDVGVGGDREQGAPSRATAKPQQSMGEASASEARGGRDANAAREPLLDAPRPRAFGHDDQARRVGGAATTSLITHRGAQARVRAREGNRE